MLVYNNYLILSRTRYVYCFLVYFSNKLAVDLNYTSYRIMTVEIKQLQRDRA